MYTTRQSLCQLDVGYCQCFVLIKSFPGAGQGGQPGAGAKARCIVKSPSVDNGVELGQSANCIAHLLRLNVDDVLFDMNGDKVT